MDQKILLRGARQLVTLRGRRGPRRGSEMNSLGVIPDGALLIVNGIIQDVGPSRRVENLAAARDAVELSADGRVIMPGFIDSRTQLIAGPPLLDDYAKRVRTGEPASPAVDEERLRAVLSASTRARFEMLARKAMREFARHGTTTVDAHTGLGLDAKSETKMLRALCAVRNRPLDIVVTWFAASRLPDEFSGSAGDYLEHLTSTMMPKVRREKLAQLADVRVGAGGFQPSGALRYLEHARNHKLARRVTADWNDATDAVSVALESEALSVDLFGSVEDADPVRLAGSEVLVKLFPGVAYHCLEQREPPARNLIDAGAAVAVATGFSSALCPTCSMPAILSLACRQMRMTPEEAVTASTINAACALGLDDQTGSLERGKDADLIMLNITDYREIPYRFGMNLVAMMMKRGDVIYPRMEFG